MRARDVCDSEYREMVVQAVQEATFVGLIAGGVIAAINVGLLLLFV